MTILVVTHTEDVTADYLILELQARGTPYFRLNTDLFPHQYRFEADPDSFTISDDWTSITRDATNAIWYRRYEAPSPGGLTASDLAYVKGESRATLDALWKTLDREFWVSNPTHISAAEGKLHQLAYARKHGVRVPETLATNDPHAAARLASRGPAVAKPFREKILEGDGSGPRRIIFTTAVPKGSKTFDGLHLAITIFQEEVPKSHDVRVTCIGDTAFGTAIHSQNREDSSLDWRRAEADDLPHEAIPLPVDIEDFCLRMLRDHHLQFGAFDFAVTPKGEWIFFELNPNGQWAWIQHLTRQPLRETLADLLENPP